MLRWELGRPKQAAPNRAGKVTLDELVERVHSDIIAAELIRADEIAPGSMLSARTGLNTALHAIDNNQRDLARLSTTSAAAAIRRATEQTRAEWMSRADAHLARFQRQSLLDQAAAFGLNVREEQAAVVVSLTALFSPGRSYLEQDRREPLDEIGWLVKWYRKVPVVVTAHTDSIGSQDDNLVLSSRRAQAVVDYLVDERGLKSEQLLAAGYGESRPIADNASEYGRARNRRVDISFLLQ